MPAVIRRVSYFNTTVRDEPGEGYQLLSAVADLGVNLLAFTAVPTGPATTQLTLFPDDIERFKAESARAGMPLVGPYPALLVQGQDVIGALAGIHESLFHAGINVFSSTAVSAGGGRYGYLMYLRPDDMDAAAQVLGIE